MDWDFDDDDGFCAGPRSAQSLEAEANIKRGEELLKNNNPEQGIPLLLKAMDDEPDYLDVVLAVSTPLPPKMAIEFLKVLERMGRAHVRRIVGPDCFELGGEHNYGAPNFWSITETRPYMRVLHRLVRMYIKEKRWDDAVTLNIEILRLCDSDNMGQRDWMVPLLLRVGRPADALYFVQRWLEADGVPRPGAGIDFGPPRRTPMPDALFQSLARWRPLQMTHSAALAAFALDGDSELARQYLHIAVQHPGVLIKVLGKFKERVDGDSHPVRTHNGLEDIRDHLWLAQDLWMQDDVWNWANSDPVVKAHVLRECSDPTCKKKEELVGQWQKCSGCKKEWYCSRICQKGNWPAHKQACKKEQNYARSLR
ncbi:hypothetical protein DFH06DRAFT_251179 [Mycena polygramma]|nr:hypothetical protein DFH06DRAFT_251179 [Mycena polygramma]